MTTQTVTIDIARIDDLLPQTQCRQCGFDGCLHYARAIVEDGVAINRCAPGGAAGIARLAAATGRPVVSLDPDFGHEMPFAVARVRAADCIGCAWCVRVCPTGAVCGSPKHLHGILEDDCTGCALCVPACPMDCIELVENGHEWTLEDAHRARELMHRTTARRLADEAAEKARLEAIRSEAKVRAPGVKSALIADIMARARKANQAGRR